LDAITPGGGTKAIPRRKHPIAMNYTNQALAYELDACLVRRITPFDLRRGLVIVNDLLAEVVGRLDQTRTRCSEWEQLHRNDLQ
jgi:hypothetical protein